MLGVKSTQRRVALWGATCVLCLAIGPPLIVKAQTANQSNKDAVSVLKQKCFQCHSDTVQMANLNLASREAMIKGGDKGSALTPGNAEASRLYRRISGLELPKMPMAPMPALSAEEIALVKSWIEHGAEWASPESPKDAQQLSGGYGKGYKERVITAEAPFLVGLPKACSL